VPLPSKRVTKAALAAAKARGVKLGITGIEILAPKFRAEAKARAEQLAPVIRELQRDGYSMRGICRRAGQAQGGRTARRRMASAARQAYHGAAWCWGVIVMRYSDELRRVGYRAQVVSKMHRAG
jgi:hypothetical protein